MIARRNLRATGPQEQPRQFALNYSKGVNVTKAPTDSDTMLYAKNLEINFDGSLSIRKPIRFVDNTLWFESAKLYDKVSTLAWANGKFRIFSNNSEPTVVCKLTTYDGTEVILPISETDGAFSWEGSPEVINLNNSTVVGNVSVKLAELDENAINTTLYDDPNPSLPRYLKITFDDAESHWIVEIVRPEETSLTIAEGEIALNPNLTLDNPYAIRDRYGAVVPTVKGILAYVPTTVVNNERVLVSPIERKLIWRLTLTNSPEVREILLDTVGSKLTLKLSKEYAVISIEPVSKPYDVHVVLDLTYNLDGTLFHRLIECDFSDYDPETWWQSFPSLPETSSNVKVIADVTVNALLGAPISSIAQFTESVKSNRYAPVSVLGTDARRVFLKAFGNYPKYEYDALYLAAWFKSTDGVSWEPITQRYNDAVPVRELDVNWKPESGDDAPGSADYVTHWYRPLEMTDEHDTVYTDFDEEYIRIDVKYIDSLDRPTQYMFRVIVAERLSENDVEYSQELQEYYPTQYRASAYVSENTATFDLHPKTEILTTDIGNAVLGRKLYYKKALYSYGHPALKNNILVSDTGSFITPLYNTIDVDTVNASEVTALIPWRDYLISATDNAIYLHSKQGDGYLTKSVNTSIGIPKSDAECCKAILNGVLFKSGTEIYQLVPNMYSGDDSTLNISVMSHAIEAYVPENTDAPAFAIATSSEYIVMIPNASSTLCLRFDFTSRHWTISEYPIPFTKYTLDEFSKIYVYGKYDENNCTYLLDAPIEYDENGNPYPHADCLVATGTSRIESDISFELDTGQKTDGINVRKQFVESKFVFATADDVEAFPMELTVSIDGDPHVTVVDVSTDVPFWKPDNESSLGVVGTAFRLTNDEVLGNSDSGILRQLVVRYSGKGHAIRHILTGRAHSNFKLYETYVKYKPLKR